MKRLVFLSLVGISVALWPAYPTRITSGISLQRSTNDNGQSRPAFINNRVDDTVKRIPVFPTERTCICQNDMQILNTRIRSEHTLLKSVQRKLEDLSNIVYNIRTIVQDYHFGDGRAAEQEFGREPFQVSFSARVGHSIPFLGPTSTIVFDDVITNNGEAYNPLTGIFTAPINGVYHMSTTILSDFNSTIETMMLVNGEEVGRMFSGAFLSRGSGSNNVLVNLKERDEVSVNVFYGNGDYVHGLWSTFMGYRIESPF